MFLYILRGDYATSERQLDPQSKQEFISYSLLGVSRPPHDGTKQACCIAQTT